MYVVFLVLNWLPKLEFLCRKKLVQVTRIGETRTGGGRGWGNSSNAERMHFSPEENVPKEKFILWFRLKLTLLTFKLHSRSLYSCGLFLRLPDNIFSGKDGGVSFQFATDVGGGFFSSVGPSRTKHRSLQDNQCSNVTTNINSVSELNFFPGGVIFSENNTKFYVIFIQF